MFTVTQAPAQGALKPALSLARRSWAREGALLLIKSGEDAERLPFDAADIADEMTALLAEGVGPKRAATLLARLRAGNLRAIDGGGEASPGKQPGLYLVRDARSR